MKIPNKLKIGGHTIKVKILNLEEKFGYWDCDTNTIFLNKKSPQDMKESTLIHEMIHVMNSTLSADRVGHALHESLSEQIYQALKDNKFLR